MIDAIVLAGAANTGPLKDVSPAASEAMILISGRPMISYVLSALLESEKIGRVIVVGPSDVADANFGLDRSERIEYLPSADSMIENLLLGLEKLAGQHRVLVVTSDVPLLTSEAVDDFIMRCKSVDADVYYPIVSEETNVSRFPGVERTYVNLKEGTFTGGNLALVAPDALTRGRRVIEQAFQMRKKPVKLARLLGFRFIVKFGMRRLSLHEIEQRAADILGYRGVAIVSPFPEVGIDVDKPSDIEVVERALRGEDGSSNPADSLS